LLISINHPARPNHLMMSNSLPCIITILGCPLSFLDDYNMISISILFGSCSIACLFALPF
jgi:hypothetical protein